MKKTLFPAVHGYRVGLGVDLTEKWDQKELREIMYRLAGEDADSAELLLESCNPEDADDLLNPGTEMVLEAVTAVYSRLGKTAAALARVFARHLPENLTMDGDPFVGPNRKNALFAYKTVTLRISDGQTVSILFHSPDNDPRKFQPDETLVAYRWMLNKKDITATVAPERGRDITLQLMARRMAQLVEANSDKFQKQQAAREALEQELVEATARREDLRTRVAAATEEAISLDESLMAEERRAVRLADQLEEQRARNERLKADAAEIGTEIEAVTKTNESPDDNPEMPGGKNYNIYEPYYKEAIEKGLSPLSPSEFMDEINSGNQNGFSLDKLKQDLAKYRQMLIDLRDKKITPRSVAGVGASQKGAANWIKGRIEQTEQDIPTGGIGNHVNAANYRGYLARLIREASESPDDSQELPSGNENNETNPAQPPSLADLDASLASSVARSLKNIAAIDSGAKGMDRALFVANLASKIKTRAKRGDNDVADAALRMVAEFNSSASKPALTQRNSVWSSTGKSYKDYAVSGITAPQQESVAPDKPASTEGFGVQPFLDARTRIAAALAEELAMAGFDPHNFPVNDPEYVLSEYAAIATEKTLSGTGAVYLNALDSLNSMTVEMEFNEDAQPGQSEPIPAVRETLTIPVPVGILESKFDSLVSQIEAFFAGFRSPLDDIQLPKMGEKISSVNQNDAADIAKAIRKDIKEILQPSGWKPSFISVKTSKYSMGQSISVTIRDVPEGFRVMAAGSGRYTTEMRSMIRVLEAIGNAYRYDNSDSQTDYFDTNFYYSVSVDPDLKQQIEDQVAKVDAVHKFNATDEFKTFVAAYVDKGEGYNPFETAKGADIEAAKHGATISWLMDAEGGAIGKVMRAGEEVASLDMGDDGKIAGTIASGTRIMFTFTDAKGNASPMMVSRSDEGAGLIKTLFTDQANGLAG
ncbi:MAG: hypothetical protein IBX50_14550, partial [Marinospirillum sp.]|uniref:defense against restriction DarA-related protein n=1 Tax=Marinospirillum sp. TaxID=2183934 RepID=UPI0019E87AEB